MFVRLDLIKAFDAIVCHFMSAVEKNKTNPTVDLYSCSSIHAEQLQEVKQWLLDFTHLDAAPPRLMLSPVTS